ncbi:MAG: rhamnulokinase [Propionibacteriaceae bacterium]|jgi:rhamnulokinase|nr:rhamnulokinase [Propionibacteriaceae bacterium]
MIDHLFAAADLGASSGRVILGRLNDGRFTLTEVHRFPTPSFENDGHLHWDAEAIRNHIITGIRAAGESGPLRSVAVDTWGVDYGRLDATGTLSEPPHHYRDARTQGVPAAFFADFGPEKLYGQAGLQVMDFNTVFQYASSAGDPRWPEVDTCLFLPDLFTYWLCGAKNAEITIASTSGLLDVGARQWSATTLAHMNQRYGIDCERVLPPLVEPGTVVGSLYREILDCDTSVIAVGSHDTASAIASIPTTTRNFAYISSGTWSLVGLELDHPILSEESRQADFTNELGIDSTLTYHRNVMGLWVLTESRRHWEAEGLDVDLQTLIEAAAHLPALVTVVDMEDPRLMPPGDMPSRLADMAQETGQPIPQTPVEYTRCIIDSLALGYRRVIRQAQNLAKTEVEVIHIVGGGCRNRLLNQLTTEATGLEVIAGPAEGTALGSLLVQARATGVLQGDLMALRHVSRASCQVDTYTPGVLGLTQSDWDNAERRAFAF